MAYLYDMQSGEMAETESVRQKVSDQEVSCRVAGYIEARTYDLIRWKISSYCPNGKNG